VPSYQGLGSPGDAGKEAAGINNRSAWLESRPNTATTTLSTPSLPSGGMLETRHKSGDRDGLGGGTLREDESVGQRPRRIRCAKCQWRPSRNGPWQCHCGLVWNTFDTRHRPRLPARACERRTERRFHQM